MKYGLIFVFTIAVAAVQSGCNRTAKNSGAAGERSSVDGTPVNGNSVEGTAWAPGSFSSNGERIYFTSTSDSGTSITYSGGPDMGMMMTGGKLACVSCHGTDAGGRRHPMGMLHMDAPDIRWSALTGHLHEEQGEKAEESGHEAGHHHDEYSLADFRNAVQNGRHPDGDKLGRSMPRWQMSDTDLEELMNYLKSLDEPGAVGTD
jgi:cytochrome c oxidase subunit 2